MILLTEILKQHMASNEAKNRLKNKQIKINGQAIQDNLSLTIKQESTELGEWLYKNLEKFYDTYFIIEYFSGDIPLLFDENAISQINDERIQKIYNFIQRHLCITISKNKHFVYEKQCI